VLGPVVFESGENGVRRLLCYAAVGYVVVGGGAEEDCARVVDTRGQEGGVG